VTTRPGSRGQYDVVADGEVVATRSRGFTAFLGGGWPTVEQVVEALRPRLPSGHAPA
jgi:hypothetical protein